MMIDLAELRAVRNDGPAWSLAAELIAWGCNPKRAVNIAQKYVGRARAEQREADAKICEDKVPDSIGSYTSAEEPNFDQSCRMCAAAIRQGETS